VGVARVAGIELWVKPKLDVQRLFFLLGCALDGKGWRDEDLALAEAPDLFTALAEAFARQTDRALQQGLVQGYRVVEEALPVLRGRLREGEQMRRRYGLAVPIEVRYDDYSVDIAENQLLRSAAERLLRMPGLPKLTRQGLLRIVLRMADVNVLVRGQQLPTWQPSRLNVRYHVALRLAELVLRGGSVEQDNGIVDVNGFMLNMAKVFEDFLSVALGAALTAYGGVCRPQDGWHLDEADRIRMRPDLVWYAESGVVAAVVDAKYKAEKPAGFPDADLYQMLAYCTALGLPRGHLVYATGNEPAAMHVVRNVGVEIVQHALDLDKPPVKVLEQVGHLAHQIVGQSTNGPRLALSGATNDGK
jgi:5-methylcytosine-specific restriction enzyme subunit McrC